MYIVYRLTKMHPNYATTFDAFHGRNARLIGSDFMYNQRLLTLFLSGIDLEKQQQTLQTVCKKLYGNKTSQWAKSAGVLRVFI